MKLAKTINKQDNFRLDFARVQKFLMSVIFNQSQLSSVSQSPTKKLSCKGM